MMTATQRRFTSILALVARGAGEGERKAARAAARRFVQKKGLSECLPSHPANGLDGFYDELIAMARTMHDDGSNDVERFVFYLGLPAFGVKAIGRALASIRSDQRAGWKSGEWTGGNDLHFLNVSEWGFEQALIEAAAAEGWTQNEADAFVATRVIR